MSRFCPGFLPFISLKHSCCRLYSHGSISSMSTRFQGHHQRQNAIHNKDSFVPKCLLSQAIGQPPHRWHSYHNVRKSFRGFRGQLTLDSSKKSRAFIAELMPSERKILLTELQNFQDRLEDKGLFLTNLHVSISKLFSLLKYFGHAQNHVDCQ